MCKESLGRERRSIFYPLKVLDMRMRTFVLSSCFAVNPNGESLKLVWVKMIGQMCAVSSGLIEI